LQSVSYSRRKRGLSIGLVHSSLSCTPEEKDVIALFPQDEPRKMSEKRTTVVSDEELEEMEDHTDWEALQEKTDEEIERAVEEDPDAVLLDEEWFEKAKLVVPASDKERITIRLDEDIVEHFKQGGPGYQSRINDVLRAYVTSKRLGGEGSE
jgi:uncharacterized protein (DUF4415 family)